MIYGKRYLKNVSKFALRKLFEHVQHLKLDVLPRHFYSEIPDIQQLKRTTYWKAPYSMINVAGIGLQSQITFVKECCTPSIIAEIKSKNILLRASQRNGEEGFGPTESAFLFAFIVNKKPKQVFQVGCGVSTAVCLMASEFAGYMPEIICVEPYPTAYLIQEAESQRITLIREKVELLDLIVVENLGDDLLFFVDSTHTLGPAGEVSRVILEMLPRLKAGARVHFHDINFPYDYDRHILDGALFFPHESVLLHAFLACNNRFRILASLSMLHYLSPDTLSACLPCYEPAENDEGLNKGTGHFPSSTYLEVVS
jgi:Methyltransferase domain